MSWAYMEVGEAVVVEEPVLQDLVGPGGVWVGHDVFDEADGVLAERLDDVEVGVLLRLQVLKVKMGPHMGKPGDGIRHPELLQTESSPVVVLHGWSSIGCMFL
jgi:hypothetical protein